MPHTQHEPQGQLDRDDLVPAVARELGSALASLRAALEGIAREFDEGDPRQARVRLAVVQTIPIARQVEALADCTDCAPLQEMTCSLEEIASSVRKALAACGMPRLLLALEDRDTCFEVDAPLLVRALALLGEELGELGDGCVMLRARLQRGAPTFTLLWPARAGTDDLLGLQLRLLRHEARRLGAEYAEELGAGACARVELCFPAARGAEVQA